MDTKKIIITVVILVVVFIVIKSLINKDEEIVSPQGKSSEYVYSSCEDRCSGNNECLKDCVFSA